MYWNWLPAFSDRLEDPGMGLTYSRSRLRHLVKTHVSKNMAQKRCSNPYESSREHCFVRLVPSEAKRACQDTRNAKQPFPGTFLVCHLQSGLPHDKLA